MQIELPTTLRPWRIGNLCPPPRDRLIEIAYKGTTLIAIYAPKLDAWTTGILQAVPPSQITRWRECSPEHLAALHEKPLTK